MPAPGPAHNREPPTRGSRRERPPSRRAGTTPARNASRRWNNTAVSQEAVIGLGAQQPAPPRVRPQEAGRPRRAVAAQDADRFQQRVVCGRGGRVDDWRGGGRRRGLLFPAAFVGCRCLTPRRGSVSSRRSSVGSRAGAPPVGSGGSSGAFAPGLSPAPVGTFPAPASSNPACRFPALGFPVAFVSRVMRPFKPGALSANRRLGIRRTARAAHITSAYSTSSSRTPLARAVASSVAVPSSRPSPFT